MENIKMPQEENYTLAMEQATMVEQQTKVILNVIGVKGLNTEGKDKLEKHMKLAITWYNKAGNLRLKMLKEAENAGN